MYTVMIWKTWDTCNERSTIIFLLLFQGSSPARPDRIYSESMLIGNFWIGGTVQTAWFYNFVAYLGLKTRFQIVGSAKTSVGMEPIEPMVTERELQTLNDIFDLFRLFTLTLPRCEFQTIRSVVQKIIVQKIRGPDCPKSFVSDAKLPTNHQWRSTAPFVKARTLGAISYFSVIY